MSETKDDNLGTNSFPERTSRKLNGILYDSKLLKEEEPVFVLRAQDKLSITTIERWLWAGKEAGVDKDLLLSVEADLQAFKEWQKKNPDLVKLPD